MLAGGAHSAAAAAPGAVSQPSAERQKFWQQGLAQARRFIAHTIAPQSIGPADDNNDIYYEARDAKGRLVGYVRDFLGAVSPNQACPCNPLNITLIFDKQAQFKTILAPAPLQKWGHEAMSDADFARLIKIVRQAPKALCEVPTVEDMVDASTGATRAALADIVVPHAALSTRRIAGLVQQTRAILQKAPADAATAKLYGILQNDAHSPSQRALALAAILTQPQNQSIRLQAYHLMTRSYLTALQGGASPLARVEDALIDFAILCEGGGAEVAAACLAFAEAKVQPAFVARCAKALAEASARGVAPDTDALLLGTLAANRGDGPTALPLLLRAAVSRPLHLFPQLYWRISQMQAQTGDVAAAQRSCERLLLQHPLIPGAAALLQQLIGDADKVAATRRALATEARQEVLSRQIEVPLHQKVAAVAGQNVPLTAPRKATVVVFFSAWCPHCQSELPHIEALSQTLAQDPALRRDIRIVGIKTAQQRDNDAAKRFWATFSHSFPVYEDAEMSAAFTAFANDCGRPTVLPTTAIIDPQGTVRFFIEPGLYKDVKSEILWAAQAALQASPA